MGVALIAKSGDSLDYNWTGWKGICKLAGESADTNLPMVNDGDEIQPSVCIRIGEAIEANADWYNREYGGGGYGKAPADEHAKFWKMSNGVEVW